MQDLTFFSLQLRSLFVSIFNEQNKPHNGFSFSEVIIIYDSVILDEDQTSGLPEFSSY